MKDMRVSFYTLGCKVNQYETQMLRERFADAGYETVGEDDPADIYIINTCTVTNLSDRKSRQRIRRVKKKNDQAVIVVTGAMRRRMRKRWQRYRVFPWWREQMKRHVSSNS